MKLQVMGGDQDASSIGQLRANFPRSYTYADRQTDAFLDCSKKAIACSKYDPASSLGPATYAPIVLNLVQYHKTEISIEWEPIPSEDGAYAHVMELGVNETQQYFNYVFGRTWSTAMPSAAELLGGVSTADARRYVLQIAAAMSGGAPVTTLTSSVADVTEARIKHSVISLLRTNTGVTLLEDKMAMALEGVRNARASAVGVARDEPGGASGRSAERAAEKSITRRSTDMAKLFALPQFQKLVTDLNAARTVPLDTNAGLGILLASSIGARLVATKAPIPHDAVNAWADAVTPTSVHEFYNDLVAVDDQGIKHPEWGNVLSEETCVKLSSCKFQCASGAKGIDWWRDVVNPILTRRYGAAWVGTISAGSRSAAELMADPLVLQKSIRVIREVCKPVLSLGSTGATSLHGVLTELSKESAFVGQLPTSPGKPKLMAQLVNTATAIWRHAHITLERHFEMPYDDMSRLGELFPTGGTVDNAIQEIKKKRIKAQELASEEDFRPTREPPPPPQASARYETADETAERKRKMRAEQLVNEERNKRLRLEQERSNGSKGDDNEVGKLARAYGVLVHKTEPRAHLGNTKYGLSEEAAVAARKGGCLAGLCRPTDGREVSTKTIKNWCTGRCKGDCPKIAHESFSRDQEPVSGDDYIVIQKALGKAALSNSNGKGGGGGGRAKGVRPGPKNGRKNFGRRGQ